MLVFSPELVVLREGGKVAATIWQRILTWNSIVAGAGV